MPTLQAPLLHRASHVLTQCQRSMRSIIQLKECSVREEERSMLLETRFSQPEKIANLAKARKRHSPLSESGRLLIIAADHTARGVLSVGSHPIAMGNRYDLLDRLTTALDIPGVDGVLATPDIIEDLL